MITTLIREPARIAAMRATPAGLRRLRAKASALVLKCQKYPAMARRQWDALQKMAEAAVWPVEDLKPYFSLLLSMTNVCLGTAEALHESLGEAGAAATDLSDVDEAAASLRSLRAEASGIWEWLTAAPAQRPLRTTAEIRAGLARGEYLSIEEAIARVGGDLPETP